jgi:protein-S-isoprenylcysteine O-methyltransferase Ste14
MGVNLKLLSAQIAAMAVVFAVVLFGAAGSVSWPAGWLWLVLFFGFVVALSGWLLRHNPGLLTERMTGIGSQGQKTWDKLLFALLQVLFVAWFAFMPLDAVRFGWSHVPLGAQVIGGVLLVASFWLFFLTFRENSFLSPAVRIQQERGQTVVSTGPYRYVRHPMYATALIWLVGTTLLLGSWWGLLPALVLTVAIAFRAVNEERTLRRELPGYDAYLQRVKYRLIPYVW